MITSDQIKDLVQRIDALKTHLGIDQKRVEIQNEEEKTFDPNFWNDPKEAEVFMRSLREKKNWVKDFEQSIILTEDLEVLLEFHKEGDASESEFIKHMRKQRNSSKGWNSRICFLKKVMI